LELSDEEEEEDEEEEDDDESAAVEVAFPSFAASGFAPDSVAGLSPDFCPERA